MRCQFQNRTIAHYVRDKVAIVPRTLEKNGR